MKPLLKLPVSKISKIDPGTKILSGTRLVYETLLAETRVVVHQGGTRSSKTYSIAQAIVLIMIQALREERPLRITISRKRMPSLRHSAMKDFFEILQGVGLYDEQYHQKTESIYAIDNVEVEFVSLDDPQKIRGRKRDILWMNEANEFGYEDFLQFSLRTTERIILDYNPSDEYHWIYDNVLTRDDVTYIESTFIDNPFLPDEVIQEILRLRETDPVAWKVYGEGKRGHSIATIYPLFEEVDAMPTDVAPIYGLDFGYNEPSALVEVRVVEDSLYVKQLLYERRLTNSAIAERMRQLIEGDWSPIYCDSANPDRVDELYRMGFNVRPADKRPYSVKAGIDFCKRHRIHVDAESEDLIREFRHYKWSQDKDGNILDMPLKQMDHAVDAMRYAVYTHWGKPVGWLMADEVDGATYHIVDESDESEGY